MKRSSEVLLKPVQSVAIVGASHRFVSKVLIENLKYMGFEGEIFLVNPKYDGIDGIRCYDSLLTIGERIDAVVALVNPNRMLSVAQEAGEVNANILIIPGGGYGEAGSLGKEMQDKILEETKKNNIVVIGPNCMGYMDMHNKFTPFIGTLKRPERPIKKGKVSVVSQSGSVIEALIATPLGLNRVYSSGNEADLNMADYIETLAKDPETSVIVLYIEAIRKPRDFLKALNLCKEYQKPVIALKIGKTNESSKIALAHSGALAGNYKIEKLVLEEHGVIFLDDLDEIVATAKMLSQPYLPNLDTIGAITVSGGQASLTLDLAKDYKVNFPDISSEIEQEIINALPELAPISNPIDTWGKSNKEYSEVSKICLDNLVKDPNIGVVAVAIDAPYGQGEHETNFTSAAAENLAKLRDITNKPFIYFTHIQEEVDSRVMDILEQSNIPVVRGTRNALAACEALFQFKNFIKGKKKLKIYDVEQNIFEEHPTLLDDNKARELLDKNNFTLPREKVVQSLEEAIVFADEIGYPVVLKAQGIAHKTEVGGVKINLGNTEELERAWSEITSLQSKSYLVQEMVQDGFEAILSYKTDSRYGPIIVFGVGGIFTELLNEAVLAIPPITTEKAEKMVNSIEFVRKSIEGFRGNPPLDLEALIGAIKQMGIMAQNNYEAVLEFEINPLRVRPKGKGVVALDVLASVPSSKFMKIGN